MTTYNTGNPLGSSDPRDLYDNAENLDNLVNGDQAAYNDRLGKSRKSWQAMEDEFVAFISASGYEFAGDYAAGIELTGYQQILRDTSGEFWRVSGTTALPYTTTGAGLPEGGAFVAVGDAALRQELANPDMGAAMVGRGVVAVDSIADLLALPEGQRKEGLRYLVKGFYAGSDVGGGEFYWDASRTAENDGGIILNGFVRVTDSINVHMFGARGDGVSDDHAAITAAMAYVSSVGGGELLFTQGLYQVTDTVQVPSYIVLVGVGMSDDNSHPASQIRGMGISGPLAGPVVAFGSGSGTPGVIAPGMRNMTVGGQSDCAVKVDNAFPVNLENIKLRGTHTDGFSFANTWSSSFRNLHTNGCLIHNACFSTGVAFNANSCENWYTSNRSEYSIYIGSPQSHGNTMRMMCCQGARYGLFVGTTGYSGWSIDTIYFENIAHPIRLGDRAAGRLARNVIITNPTLMAAPDQWHDWAHEVDAAIDLDYANSCIIDMPLYMSTHSLNSVGSVGITGDGSGAKAYAAIGSDGVIRGVSVVKGGSGYTTATLTFPSSGSGAVGEAIIVGGVITGVTMTSGGTGYEQPGGLPLEVIYNNAINCTIRGGSRLIGPSVAAHGSEAFIGRRSTASGSSGVYVEDTQLSIGSQGAFGRARIFKSTGFSSTHFVEYTNGSGDRILRSFQPIIFDRITNLV